MGGWLKITLWKRVMLGLVLGILLGLGLHYGVGETGINIATDWIYPFGKAFINLIKMLVVPLIFTTLVSGVTAMGDPAKLGSLGGRALGLYMGTTLIAVTIGLSIGTLVQPGAGFDLGLVSKDAIAEQQSKIDSLAGGN